MINTRSNGKVKKLVIEEKKNSLERICDKLENDSKGNQKLFRKALKR